ncbi:MAG: efflux RND transporter periplasmic adaptor subunit [Oligoflexus sp.]|nr:efflux RND transporter periplasmic adaptor subunit [Pseudopedobacter sp.]
MNTKINKYPTLILLGLSLSFIISACSQNKTESNEKVKKKEQVVETVFPIKDQPIYSISLPGELKPYEEVIIYPKTKGFVKKLYADRGTLVRKGQLLAVLEAPEVLQKNALDRSSAQKFKEQYLYSQQSYQRLKKASQKSGAVAAIELERAMSQFKSDSAAYESAKANSNISGQLGRYLQIRSPFDGIVTQRNISEGALVGENMNTALFSVAQNNRLRLVLAIPEKHASAINKNTIATFTVSGLPGRTFKASLSRSADVLDKSSRSVNVEFDINHQTLLNGGEYAQAKIRLQRPDSTLWVPTSSVINAQAGVFVVRITNGIIERVPVLTGSQLDGKIEVYGDLSVTDKIAKTGSEELIEGGKTNIK